MLESPLSCVIFAEENNSVVGVCTGQLTISTAEGTVSLLVEDVIVAKTWRGKGIGRQLLDRMSRWASARSFQHAAPR